MNIPLLSAIFTISSTVLMGILVIVAIVTGFDSAVYIVGAIVAGFVISLPVSVVVTKKLSRLSNDPTPITKD